jgi:hypothetical protein
MSNAITFPFLVLEYTVLIFIIIPFSKFESKVSDHRGLHLCKLEIWLLVLKKLFLKKIYLISNLNLLFLMTTSTKFESIWLSRRIKCQVDAHMSLNHKPEQINLYQKRTIVYFIMGFD